ncbi:acyl-CoA dehydrogenase family protein [Nocardia salmonicida]|uniref:acyl-CoA dehydrogenase family protein n=1 Tax=Nocardia salmonicida TaxID=53431 RepID=UPI00363117ED
MPTTTSRITPALIPSRDDIVARATALREILQEEAPAADQQRRLADRVINEITDAGLLRLTTPTRFGGYDANMRTFLEVAVALGRGCTSASWVSSVWNVGSFIVSLFPDDVQDQVWGQNPDTRAALVLGGMKPDVEWVDGGAVITGEWPYASGSLHSEWVTVLLAEKPVDGPPKLTLALLQADKVTVRDTWFFTGMRGTGSNTIVADRVFVPSERLVPFLPIANGAAGTLPGQHTRYQDCLSGIFSIGLIGPLIGGAQAVLQYVIEKGPTRPVAFSTFPNQAASPSFQLDVAAAARRIDTALFHAGRIADVVDEFAAAGKDIDLLTRSRLKADSAHVARECRDAIDTLLSAYGSSAFAETNPLQRIWRDVNVGSRHVAFGMGIPDQQYGRALVGGNPCDISYLV